MANAKSITLIGTLAFLVCLPAMGGTAQNLVVQDVKLDEHKAVITLRNNSGKVITGFTLNIVEVYRDGSDDRASNHEVTEDYGPLLTAQGKAFNPGEEKQEIIPYGHQAPSQVKVKPVAVIYADSSAEGNKDSLDRIVVVRKGMAAAVRRSLEIMQAALADANEAHPAAKAAKQLEAESRLKEPRPMDRGDLKNEANNLKNVESEGGDERQALAQRIAQLKQELRLFAQQAAVRGPQ